MRYLYTILAIGFTLAMWTTRNLTSTMGQWLMVLFTLLMWGFIAMAVCEWTSHLEGRYL